MDILSKFFKSTQTQKSNTSSQTNKISSKNDRNRDRCPYCHTIFTKSPKKKTKCAHCGEECFVRTKQDIFNSDLLTQEDALAIDFFKELQYLGATNEDYVNIETELSKKWGIKVGSYDIVWGISNKLMGQPPNIENDFDKKNSMLQHAKMISFAQALYQLRRGNNPKGYLESVHNYEIQMGIHSGLSLAYFVVETQSCCSECSKYQGKEYSAEELEKEPALPIKECTNKLSLTDKYAWCTCWYSPAYL